MEYWGNALEGRGLLFYDNIELQVDDDISSPRKSVNGWDLKSPSDFDKNMLNPNPKTVDNLEFTDSGFPEIITNSLSSDPSLGCLAAEISDDSSNTVSSLLGELEFGSRVSSSVMKSSNRKSSSLVDLRLRGLADSGEINNHKSSKGSPVLSPVGFSSPAKRARTENLYSQVHVCQVHGCDKDLSSSKDYYKRHKVCDVHSKASKVFVKGVEQRFCQQCSRFHLLAEFDDGKRSCRKRLAGHNERRRKSHMGTCSGKSHKLPQYSQGSTRFLGTSIQQGTTFVFPEMLRGGFLRAEGYGHDNGCKRSKLEGPTYSPQVSVPISKGQSSPKSIFHLHGKGKQYSSSIFTSETEPPVLNMASTVQELSCISNTSRALSLLSAQWRNLSRHSASIPMAVPLIMQGAHHPQRYLDQSSANGFHSSGTYSMMGVDQVGTHMVPNAGVDVDLEVRADGISQSLESINAGATVDLHQLSSHLQRVEQQKNSMLVKPENDIFCCFPSACGV